jgi:hypothetical protein
MHIHLLIDSLIKKYPTAQLRTTDGLNVDSDGQMANLKGHEPYGRIIYQDFGKKYYVKQDIKSRKERLQTTQRTIIKVLHYRAGL